MTKGIHKRNQAQETAARACALLDANPGLSWTALAAAMGVSRKTAGYYIGIHRDGWKPGDDLPRVRR